VRQSLLLLVLLAALAAPAVLADSAPANARDAARCLQKHRLLVSPGSIRVTANSPKVPALQINFALIPKLGLNSGTLAFEKSALSAKAVAREYLTARLKQLRRAGLKVSEARVRQTYSVKNNVIILWDIDEGSSHPPSGHASARRVVFSCIVG
jgi:hypothetical protein